MDSPSFDTRSDGASIHHFDGFLCMPGFKSNRATCG
jgi:hypothetical protein